MAVIINELEVVLESPAQKPAGAPSPSAAPSSQHIQPLDLENIQERDARAAYRLLAH